METVNLPSYTSIVSVRQILKVLIQRCAFCDVIYW